MAGPEYSPMYKPNPSTTGTVSVHLGLHLRRGSTPKASRTLTVSTLPKFGSSSSDAQRRLHLRRGSTSRVFRAPLEFFPIRPVPRSASVPPSEVPLLRFELQY
jgi:hypothetical protein